MKKVLKLFITMLSVLVWASQAYMVVDTVYSQARTANWEKQLTAAGIVEIQTPNGVPIGSGILYHILSWQIKDGTASACTIKIEQKNVATWSDLTTIATCTSDGSVAIVADQAPYLRVNLATFTATTGTTIIPPGSRVRMRRP